MAATGARKDHQTSAYFKVEIEGVEAGGFRKCSGVRTETEVFEYQEGGDNESVRKLLGPTKTSNITLTKGWVNEDALFGWRDKIASSGDNKIERKSGSIICIAEDGKTEVKRWNFKKAWPVRWELGELDASSSAAFCEILEIAVEGLSKG
jgi:phage tail-like protein